MFNYPVGVSFDPTTQSVFVSDLLTSRVRRISPALQVSTYAGSGIATWADGLGTFASFNFPSGVSVDYLGNVYVGDSNNHRVRKISPSGAVSTLAGSGTAGSGNGFGTSAQLNSPTDIALDSSSEFGYIVEQEGCRIRSIELSSGSVSTLAGNGTKGFTDSPTGLLSQFNNPTSAVWHTSGVLYVADWNNHRIRCIDVPSSSVTTLAGSGATGGANGAGTLASFNSPRGLALDSTFSTLYVSEWAGQRIRTISLSTALVLTIAGSGAESNVNGFGLAAGFQAPVHLACSPSGQLYTAEYSNRIRVLACVPCPAGYFCSSGTPVLCPAGSYCPLSSINATLCPSGSFSNFTGASKISTCTPCSAGYFSATAGAALSSTCTPCTAGTYSTTPGANSTAVCLPCAAGSFSPQGATTCAFIATTCPVGTFANVSASACAPCSPATACPVSGLSAQPPCYWNVSTLAGNGTAGWADGLGSAAMFSGPLGVSVDPVTLSVYVGDWAGNRVRKISPTGLVSTVAGSGSGAWADGIGTAAFFHLPHGTPVDALGNVYVGDWTTHRIRKISPSGVVSTLAGSGTAGTANGIGTAAQLIHPTDIAIDASGVMGYIVEQQGHKIRSLVLSTAAVSTLAGSGTAGFADNSNGHFAQFSGPTSAVWHPSGVLYVADGCCGNNRIRSILIFTTAVSTLAGNGSAGSFDGVGTSATFNQPRGITLDATFSTLYVAEQSGNRIRSISLSTAQVQTIAGSGITSFVNGFGVSAGLSAPCFLSISPLGVLYSADFGNNRIRALTCVPCPASFYCSSGAPILCPAGTYCPLSSFIPMPCPAGTYNNATGSSSLSACLSCPCPSTCTLPGAQFALSCSPSLSRSPSYTPTPTRTASSSPTFSPAPTTSPTPTSTLSQTLTPSSSPTQTPSLSPTRTSTVSPTPSTSPPPFSCASSTCFSPFLGTPSSPLGLGGPISAPSFTLPSPLLASFPYIFTTFSVVLPQPPSLGESTTLRCAAADAKAERALALAILPPARACPSLPACAIIPSSAAPGGGTPPPLFINFSLSATANATLTTSILCTLLSTPLALSTAAGLPYPRYGTSTSLPPLPATATPFSLPLLSAVLRESATVPGFFSILGGGAGVGAPPLRLPPFSSLAPSCPDFGSLQLSAQASLWGNHSLVLSCPAALQVLAELAASAATEGSAPAPPSFSPTLSGSRHLLLVASPLTPFPSPPFLSVSLGSTPCTLNWVLFGSLASITTPPLSTLCSSNGADTSDCGVFPLTILYTTPGALPLPAIYPPLLPTADWTAQLTELATTGIPSLVPPSPLSPTPPSTKAPPPLSLSASLIGLPPALLLPTAAALTPPGTGIRVIAACSGDPSFAPPELCAVAAGVQSLNGSAQVCAWGSGDSCQPCPPGALCPGGMQLLTLPGFWVPSLASPPSDLYPCPAPDALQRCPGYAALLASGVGASSTGCGPGYRGQVCGACDTGYFPQRGLCVSCPPFSVLALAAPLLIFIGGLFALGGVLAVAVYAMLQRRAGCVRGGVGVREAAEPVAHLMVWSWVAAQSLASLFSQSRALAPPALGGLYSAFAALQFQGIALDPACYDSIPFASFFAALGVVGGAYCLTAASLLGLRYSSAPLVRALSRLLLTAMALVLTLGYGALTSEISGALVCTTASPMTVNTYLQTSNDGSALLSALPQFTPADLPTLLAASQNPVAAAASGLVSALQLVIPVSVLANNPFSVCGEGAHRTVRPLAYFLCLSFTLFLPLAHFALLWSAGHCKGLRRTMAFKGMLGPAAVVAQPLPDPAAVAPPLTMVLCSALGDSTLLPSGAWFVPAQQLQLALITGLLAFSTARLPMPLFLACQGTVLALNLGLGALVARLRLFTPENAWKWPVVLLLSLVTGIAAVMNALLRLLSGGALSAQARTGLALVPLVLAFASFFTLMVSWWHSLRQRGLHFIARRPPSELWAAHTDEDGDTYWWNPVLVASAWVLPPNAATVCGWRQGAGGQWVNEMTGEVSSTPPHPVPAPKHPARPAAQSQWRRVKGEEGLKFWVDVESGETAWEIPEGGVPLRQRRRSKSARKTAQGAAHEEEAAPPLPAGQGGLIGEEEAPEQLPPEQGQAEEPKKSAREELLDNFFASLPGKSPT
jgi:hypothetical protein